MITYTSGNIFEKEVDGIVNPVNCDGIMGKGLALEFRTHFPDNYAKYVRACKKGDVDIGIMFITFDQREYGHIINFPTKKTWRMKSKIEWIKEGLIDLRWAIVNYEIMSIAIPALGCGLGGLNFEQVQPLIEKYLGDLEGIDITVYKQFEERR